jgi:hypothetical protein
MNWKEEKFKEVEKEVIRTKHNQTMIEWERL